ncbi:hypothetical protein [Parasphingorhabdus halotolerans]|uniref:Uncharacterized protein n=1 Tax=Parasphingorhabdus halotolerans TaxID=2725558 RepID=A0A6H2DN31_9SPHN|nr:hypothetical protein [Parasphingorhabdus halotolerans]QJB69790.1 hypothetical protein HF685_11285 [Parasphingorhabdus halotolerans]
MDDAENEKLTTLADGMDELLDEKYYVEVDETTITINVKYPYEIPISQCNSTDKLLAWIIHLTEKTWIAPKVLREFAYKAASAGDFDLPHV